MNLDLVGLTDKIASHAMATGHFTVVNTHEPERPPSQGLICAVWVDDMSPTKSGLDSTSVVLTFRVQLQMNWQVEPKGMLDRALVAAVDDLIAAYSGDFTLDGSIQTVDLLGKAGEPLGFEAGWVQEDETLTRVVTITLPVIINDVFTQAA